MNWLKNIVSKVYRSSDGNTDSLTIIATVPNMDDFEFHIHSCPDQYISGDLLRDKIWEPFETEVFRRLCRPGDFVVDIGANIGWYSVIASRLVGRSGRVLSLEPEARNLCLLKKNIAKSGGAGQTEIFNVALGDRETRSKLFLSQNNLGGHQLFEDGAPRDFVVVKVQTLDALFADSPHKPTLVKSDTQGSEARIFRGGSRLLAGGWRPVFILEFWPYGLINSGDDPLKLWESLVSLGYSLYELSEGNPKLITLTEDRLRTRMSSDISPQSGGFINLLCLPHKSERLHSVLDLIEKA